MLLVADYARDGSDLVLTGADGSQVVIQDYFAQTEPPVLMTESGAIVSADLAAKLAGPLAPGEYSQAEGSLGVQPIGNIETIEGTVSATRPGGVQVVLGEGDAVFQGDVIETATGATVNIVFVDDSTFAMDEDGRMVLDELIYDPGTNEGSLSSQWSRVCSRSSRARSPGLVRRRCSSTLRWPASAFAALRSLSRWVSRARTP